MMSWLMHRSCSELTPQDGAEDAMISSHVIADVQQVAILLIPQPQGAANADGRAEVVQATASRIVSR